MSTGPADAIKPGRNFGSTVVTQNQGSLQPAVNSVNVKLTNVYPVLTILNSKHSGDTSNNDTDRSVGICQVPAAGQVDQDIAEVKQKNTKNKHEITSILPLPPQLNKGR